MHTQSKPLFFSQSELLRPASWTLADHDNSTLKTGFIFVSWYFLFVFPMSFSTATNKGALFPDRRKQLARRLQRSAPRARSSGRWSSTCRSRSSAWSRGPARSSPAAPSASAGAAEAVRQIGPRSQKALQLGALSAFSVGSTGWFSNIFPTSAPNGLLR